MRFGEPPRIEHVLLERRAFRAQSSAIGGMIGIAFDVDYLRRDVLRLIANRIDKNAATYSAIGAGRVRFRGARDLQFAKLRVGRLQIKAKNSNCCATKSRNFEKVPPAGCHG